MQLFLVCITRDWGDRNRLYGERCSYRSSIARQQRWAVAVYPATGCCCCLGGVVAATWCIVDYSWAAIHRTHLPLYTERWWSRRLVDRPTSASDAHCVVSISGLDADGAGLIDW